MNVKRTLSGFLSTALLCWLFWVLITGQVTAIFTGHPSAQVLIAGAIVSLAVSWFSSRFFIHSRAFHLFRPDRLLNLLVYCICIFPVELVKANIDVAKRALSPKLPVNPGIVRVPVDLEGDYAQAMLANSITLTPGTITMDIVESEGQTWYYIHWIDVKTADPSEAGEQIKGTLERAVRRIWK